jgi:hypothetical protein
MWNEVSAAGKQARIKTVSKAQGGKHREAPTHESGHKAIQQTREQASTGRAGEEGAAGEHLRVTPLTSASSEAQTRRQTPPSWSERAGAAVGLYCASSRKAGSTSLSPFLALHRSSSRPLASPATPVAAKNPLCCN